MLFSVYCSEQWVAATRRRTALDMPVLDSRAPEENIHARIVDISAFAQFDWFSHVWYIDYPKDAATLRRQLGWWLGVAENAGLSLCYIVLTQKCRPIVRSSVQPVTSDEKLQPGIKQMIINFDCAVNQKIGDHCTDGEVINELPDIPMIPNDVVIEDDIFKVELNPLGTSPNIKLAEADDWTPAGTSPDIKLAEADDWTPESFDTYSVYISTSVTTCRRQLLVCSGC